ncbi:hypothetical protein C8Z91_02200 [Paenibacillus elgii]|uniref:Uncharacterized protein n=1 Tax=Paenibacillus elgii TaxID=189691 RepID=A0A2T6G927_9BACL|nr:hypothetical protein C8Z91_02200 [Paenibacillus elgii]
MVVRCLKRRNKTTRKNQKRGPQPLGQPLVPGVQIATPGFIRKNQKRELLLLLEPTAVAGAPIAKLDFIRKNQERELHLPESAAPLLVSPQVTITRC